MRPLHILGILPSLLLLLGSGCTGPGEATALRDTDICAGDGCEQDPLCDGADCLHGDADDGDNTPGYDTLPGCEPNCRTADGVKWVPIPAGTFGMGCSNGDQDCDTDEHPLHQVKVSAFEMMDAEVTEAQYVQVLVMNPSLHAYGDEYPVDNVTWFQARDFCQAIGGRLPTEAEWEYAARGGTATRYPCGVDSSCLDAISWYDKNSGGGKHPVKQKVANGFGLYDMTGNLWEWVNDWYSAEYYARSPAEDPRGPVKGSYRAIRGGSFLNYFFVVFLRVSNRFANEPAVGYDSVGFRCARSK